MPTQTAPSTGPTRCQQKPPLESVTQTFACRSDFSCVCLESLIVCFVLGERDLTGHLFLQEDLTREFCERQCGSFDYQYFGLQYQSECYCGNTYGRYDKVDDSRCNAKCSGNRAQICGGDLVNSVYEVDPDLKQPRPPVDPNAQPLLALVMIVKDEAHTLPTTLLPLRAYLDYYYILDTGSTDGTQDAIRKVLGDRGEIWEEPFIDYGRSRNRVLDIAQQSKHPPVFVLMLSADETVYNAYSLRKFVEQHRDSTGEAHEAYPVVMDVGWKFDSLRLSRTDKGWRYVGRVHEYLAAPDHKWHPSLRVPDAYIKFRVTDPVRRSNREYVIRDILLQEKSEKPYDTRTAFYLARTYNVIGNHSAALDEFRRRVSLGGWQEEVYESLYAIAWQLEALGRPWIEIQEAFLDAYDHSNERAEPLYSIASHYYKEKKLGLAYMYAYHASTLPYPTQAVLWVQQAVYDWQCHFLVGMTAHKLGPLKYAEGAYSLMVALDKHPGDKVMEDQLTRYKSMMTADQWRQVETRFNPTLLPPILTPNPNSNSNENNNLKINPEKNLFTSRRNIPFLTAIDEVTNNRSSLLEGFAWSWVLVGTALGFVFVGLITVLMFCCRKGKVFRGADGQLSDKVV